METVDVPGDVVHHPHGVQVVEGSLASAQPAGQQLDNSLHKIMLCKV